MHPRNFITTFFLVLVYSSRALARFCWWCVGGSVRWGWGGFVWTNHSERAFCSHVLSRASANCCRVFGLWFHPPPQMDAGALLSVRLLGMSAGWFPLVSNLLQSRCFIYYLGGRFTP